jgi:glycine cleavage system H lipoate-binding protein
MTFLVVVTFFALFITIDYVMTHRRLARAEIVDAPAELPVLEPRWVAGYLMPEGLHYHRGHTWARPADGGEVVVGLDDFARRLVGPATRLQAPAVGTRLVQGGPAFSLGLDGHVAKLVSPVEGEVAEVNADVVRRPSLAIDDPYGRGWILKLHPRDIGANLRNLLTGRLARLWMEDSRQALDLRLMALSGSVMQDGGEPVAELTRHLKQEDWERLVHDFLLT